MTLPDYAHAQAYALTRLARELSPRLYYHSIAHTRDDVLVAAERIAQLAGASAEELLLVRTAAVFHDLGFVEQRLGHEVISTRIARAMLPQWGYQPQHIDRIIGMIMATQLPQTPQTFYEEVLADADLDVLGREDFWPRNDALRAELAAFGQTHTDVEWYTSQLTFIETHRYFTPQARTLRDAGKHHFLQEMIQRLKAAEAA